MLNRVVTIVLMCAAAMQAQAHIADSIGTRKVNGVAYIVHLVSPGETLYGVSKTYGTDVKTLQNLNPDQADGLKVGQELLVPMKNTSKTTTVNHKTHVVAPGETMYGISKQYGITVDQLKKWNNLGGDNLNVGQSLAVSEPQKTDYAPTYNYDRYNNTTDSTKKTTTNTTTNYSTIPKDTGYGNYYVKLKDNKYNLDTVKVSSITTSEGGYDRVTETGVAEVQTGTVLDPYKYVCYHRSAETGTIVQIKNTATGVSVFCRVIGKYAPTGPTDKTIVQVSHKVMERTTSTDYKFPVEVSYIP